MLSIFWRNIIKCFIKFNCTIIYPLFQIISEDSNVPVIGITNTDINRSNITYNGPIIAQDMDTRNKTGDIKLIIIDNEQFNNEKDKVNVLKKFIYDNLYISDLRWNKIYHSSFIYFIFTIYLHSYIILLKL